MSKNPSDLQWDLIQSHIKQSADIYGNKSANLLELDKIAKKISQEIDLNVAIPEICPFPNADLLKYLDDYAPKWRNLWGDFQKDSQNKAPAILAELQKLIIETFAQPQNKLPKEIEDVMVQYTETIRKKDPNAMLMVRSTGKEDSLEVANPGGNDSIAAVKLEVQSIKEAMGLVVASYFGEKSFKQRLLRQQNIFEEPFMPVLLQHMIGEPLKGNLEPKNVIKSGVMYSSETDTRIQLAPGHGELIVNSKGPFDTFFVTRENVVHAIIEPKPMRLVPNEIVDHSTGKKKRALLETVNPKYLQNMPSISTEIAFKLGKAAKAIEKYYGKPMDIEFVYDPGDPAKPNSDILYLVQARPIPEVKTICPSQRRQKPLQSKNFNLSLKFLRPLHRINCL